MQIVWWNTYMNYNARKVFDEKLELTMYDNVWIRNVMLLNSIKWCKMLSSPKWTTRTESKFNYAEFQNQAILPSAPYSCGYMTT